jgi:hypothetical protein
MRGFVVVLIVVVLAFFAGWAVGRGAVDGLRDEVSRLQSQAQSMTDELREANLRSDLHGALAELRVVYTDVAENNFGEARRSLRTVGETIDGVYERTTESGALRTELESVRADLRDIEADLSELRVESREKIERLVGRLQRLAER